MTNPAQKARSAFLRNLLVTGQHSDFVITCGGDTYNVHKAIVCSQSDFFQRSEGFSQGKEAATAEVDLPEDDPAMVKLLVQYMYENDYEPTIAETDELCEPARQLRKEASQRRGGYLLSFPHTCDHNCGVCRPYICEHHRCGYHCYKDCDKFICKTCSPILQIDCNALLIHSKMYEIGDKYGVTGIKEFACEKFSQLCMEGWNTDTFIEAAEHVLTTTPDGDNGLRQVLCETIASHKTLLKKPDIEELLGTHAGFALQVLKRYTARH